MSDRNELLERSLKKFVSQIDGLRKAQEEKESKIVRYETKLAEMGKRVEQASEEKEEMVALRRTNDELNAVVKRYQESLKNQESQVTFLEECLR